MRRIAALPLLFFIYSCSASDATVGVADDTVKSPLAGTATTVAMSRVDLGTLGGQSSYAADINSDDIVVGWSETTTGTTHAFRWNSGSGMVDLGTLPGDDISRAVSVLGGTTGEILGMSGKNGRWTPVVWSATGSVRALTIPLPSNSSITLPTAFNVRGEVVGSDAGGREAGWIWSEAEGKNDLSASLAGALGGNASDITESGLVVLTIGATTCVHNPSCWRTYLWQKASGYRAVGLFERNSESSVVGLGANESGTVVGWASVGDSESAPWRWDQSKGFTRLAGYSASGSSYGYATALNSTGTTVGASLEPGSGSIVASLWLTDGSIVRLSPSDPNPSVAVAINERGNVAGWAALAGGVNHAVLWKTSATTSAVVLSPPTAMRGAASTSSSGCLGDVRSITSRQSLFACVSKADFARKR